MPNIVNTSRYCKVQTNQMFSDKTFLWQDDAVRVVLRSSTAERPTVNRMVPGSNPGAGAGR